MLERINWDLAIAAGVALGCIGLMVAIACSIVWCFTALSDMHARNHARAIEFIEKHIDLEKAKHGG